MLLVQMEMLEPGLKIAITAFKSVSKILTWEKKMNSKANANLSIVASSQFSTIDQKVRLFVKKFGKFSLFYGDYLASLHSKKRKVNCPNLTK